MKDALIVLVEVSRSLLNNMSVKRSWILSTHLAGSNVRVLSSSSKKCNVTGIDNHEILGLDLVQCGVLVQTYHELMSMNTHGRGHSIHSLGKIEWYTITVYDKSVQVGDNKE